MARCRLQLLSVAALVGMAGTGCAHSYQSSSAMQPNASDQQKQEQASKQAEIDVKSAQINGSNLSPEQKQRLLEQVRASGGK